IFFDYQVQSAPAANDRHKLNLAGNVWISASKFGFQGNESIAVAFSWYKISTKTLEGFGVDHRTFVGTETVDLLWDKASLKFTGHPRSKVFLGSYVIGDDQTDLAIYEVAVRVND